MFLKKINTLLFIIISLLYFSCKKNQDIPISEGNRYHKEAIFYEKWQKIHEYITDYAFPLEKVYSLSGNFGEIRNNHFHSGLDIKVDGQIGMPILAVQDGYVFKAGVSEKGYGKVLYVRHLDGYYTIYAHLSGFADSIEKRIQRAQEIEGQTEVTVYFRSPKIWVKKGEMIAYSGSTGASQAPHLHLELRDFQHRFQNMLPYYQDVLTDNTAPTVSGVAVYSLDSLNQPIDKQVFTLKKQNNAYFISEPIETKGKIGIAFSAFDQIDHSHNKLGIYKASLWLGDSLYYHYCLKDFSYQEQKNVHFHTDYSEDGNFERCFLIDGNELQAYSTKNKGIIQVKNGEIRNFTLMLSDLHGNTSYIFGQLKGT